MTERMVLAGWGGQGTILLGKLLATAVMKEGKHVAAFPCYGAEVRGGTAYCQVIYSTEPVYSPIVARADSLVIMNQPSYERFRPVLVPKGLLVLNSTMVVDEGPQRGARRVRVPATEAAIKLGNVIVSNMVMLGAYRYATNCVSMQTIEKVLQEVLVGAKAKLIPLNLKAIALGEELARNDAWRPA